MTKSKKNKILVIGWDAADWNVINPLISQGKMPALKKLMEGGSFGRIQTLDPPLSPMLWTSIATGFRADKHGIGGFVEPTPAGDGLRPVTTTSRKVKAIWNILNQEGWKSNVLAWWPSNPAEPINGVMVSNLYQIATKALGENWDMPNGTVHPEELADQMKEFRVHPHEITLEMALPFIPNLAQDQELRQAPKTLSVLKTLANAATVHAASTYLMEETEWDFMAIYHDAIDHFCHVAMKYFPPRRPEIPEKDYEDFKDVVEAGYRFHDMMLQRTLELIDDTTTVILLSDHGFYSDHQRPLYIPKEPSGPAVEHSPYGIFVISGPGIKKNHSISGASIIDITPTILYHAGLPVGQDMEGKVLYSCFENAVAAQFIDSWENVPGDTGQHDPMLREDPWAAQEALQQLVELGYIEALDDDKLQQVEKCKRENQYYVARNMINGGRIIPAIELLERIYSESKILRYGQRLAFAYLNRKMYLKCNDLIQELKEIYRTDSKKYIETNNDAFGNKEFEEPLYFEYIEGLLLLAMNKPRLALPLLEKVQTKNTNNAQVAISIAKIHTLRKNFNAAEKQYITALAIDERSTAAHYGLGITFLRRNMLNEALDEFLIALENDFYQANIHYHLGEALAKMELWEDAVNAFSTCIKLSPGTTKAHKWLVEIYTKQLLQEDNAKASIDFLDNKIKGEIIVCTSVNKSNYAKFMKILSDSGLPVIPENEEYYQAKKSLFKTKWLETALGKLIYIPCRFLNELPNHFSYKLIYIEEEITEIEFYKKSDPKNKQPENIISIKDLADFQKDKQVIDLWIESQPALPSLFINLKELIHSPNDISAVLSDFLNSNIRLIVNDKNGAC
jgi:predicted AlkP superfamily phosphohydrolase/phosphomutase/tetratricopeptide (TPR) repeat protein